MTPKLLAALAVLGFVMPSQSVFKRMAIGRDELTVTALKADGLLTLAPVLARDAFAALGLKSSPGDLTVNASIFIKYPGRCRVELTPASQGKTVAFVWAQGKHRAEGGELGPLGAAFDHACALLTPRNAADGGTREWLTKYVSALKVDTKLTSLGRFAGGTALVVGDRTGQTQPQLWVSKDRFLPVRLKWTDDKGAGWDLRFLDYSSPSTAEWYPRVLELHKGSELWARLTVTAGDGKAELDQVKF